MRRNAHEPAEAVSGVSAPLPSGSLLGDLHEYVARRPQLPTLVEAASEEQREELTRRILQRLGVDVAAYAVLNLHRIGVEAPARNVFEELERWDLARACWPHHLAPLERQDGRIRCVRVRLLRWPLFQMDLREDQDTPSQLAVDNTRLLLYECRGGYPIGIFSVVVRSSLRELGETEQSQVFFVVSFDFWGRKGSRLVRLVRPIWEWVHNRVTAHVLNRFKALCEARFELTAGPGTLHGETPAKR